MQRHSGTRLKPAKYQRKMLVGWKSVSGIPHGVLDIVIEHGPKERESYRLLQCPKRFYLELLCLPNPEVLMNQLLRMYLGSE